MISAMGADEDTGQAADPVFVAYLRAKAAADKDMPARGLNPTIVRPGY